MDDAISDYAANATPEQIAGWDALSPERIYAAVLDLFPKVPARIADIGAGTGRDAAWLAEQGHRVLAVEPVRAFREAGAALHRGIIWLDDRLPDLEETQRHAPFDLVLLCAVWHHLDARARARAMPALARFVEPGGMLILSLRHDPGGGPHSHPAPPHEANVLAHAAGFELIRQAEAASVHAESRARGVHWTWLAFSKPS
jgi:SAM-dependent methyltransferase